MARQATYTKKELHHSKLPGVASLKVHGFYGSNMTIFHFVMKVRHCHKDFYETGVENYLYSMQLNSCVITKSVCQLNFSWHVLMQALT